MEGHESEEYFTKLFVLEIGLGHFGAEYAVNPNLGERLRHWGILENRGWGERPSLTRADGPTSFSLVGCVTGRRRCALLHR